MVAFYAFVKVEQRAEAPLVVLAWFRTRNFAFPVLSQMLTNFAYMGGFFLIPQVLGKPRGLGLDTATVGNLVIARPLAFSITAPLAALVTMRVGERIAGVVGALGVVVSMVLWSTVGFDTSYPYIIAATALSGIGLGIASPALDLADGELGRRAGPRCRRRDAAADDADRRGAGRGRAWRPSASRPPPTTSARSTPRSWWAR